MVTQHPTTRDRHDMTAAQLVYRLVSACLAENDPRAALESLAGVLCDAASAAHAEAFDQLYSSPGAHPAHPLGLEYRRNAEELRGLAGYVERVAQHTPELEPA